MMDTQERNSFQLKFMFGAKIPFEIKEEVLEWRQGVRRMSIELKTITGFGLRRMPKILNAPASELIIVSVKGTTQTRYRVPVDPDHAETTALLAALAVRLPGKDARTMSPSAAAEIVPPPSARSDWLNTRVVIGVMLVAAAAMTGVVGRTMGGGGSNAFEAGKRAGYGVAVLVGVGVGVWLVISGLRRAKKARTANQGPSEPAR